MGDEDALFARPTSAERLSDELAHARRVLLCPSRALAWRCGVVALVSIAAVVAGVLGVAIPELTILTLVVEALAFFFIGELVGKFLSVNRWIKSVQAYLASLDIPDTEYYQQKSRRAAQHFLASENSAIAMSVIAGMALIAVCAMPMLHTAAIVGAPIIGVCLGVASGARFGAVQQLTSLRRGLGYSPIPADVSMRRYAQAARAGRRAPGRAEEALQAMWCGKGDLDKARRTLARHHIPDVRDTDFEPRHQGAMPIWDRRGIAWQDAEHPGTEHTCAPWSVALFDGGTDKAAAFVFCPCGGKRVADDIDSPWVERNRREPTATRP